MAGRCKEALAMPREAHVEPWLSELELLEWVRAGDSRGAYQRRLAVWLTYLRHYPAHEVAALLGVSTPAVWRWLSQYNRQGPVGLARKGRGGRRWAFLTLDRERELLAALQEEAGRGRVLTAKQIHGRVRQAVGKKVSLDYVYRLLHRHGWRKLGPRPRHVEADPQAQAEFKKNSLKSSRKR
jgi:transposase